MTEAVMTSKPEPQPETTVVTRLEADPTSPPAAHPSKPRTQRPRLVVPPSRSTADAAVGVASVALSPSPPAAATRPEPVLAFIELEIEARQCPDLEALRFAMVNSVRRLADYELALLIEPGRTGVPGITRCSGVSAVDANAPIVQAVGRWLRDQRNADLAQRTDPRQADIDRDLAASAPGLEPIGCAQACWLPVLGRDARRLGALLLLKREPWQPHDLALLLPMMGAYGHAWEALLSRPGGRIAAVSGRMWRRPAVVAVAVLAAIAALIPVPMSALAPAEVVAVAPVLVTAPLDGVVADILEPPGAWVEKETPILQLVDVKLRNELEVASRNVAVAEARHFKIVQTATAAQKDAQELATSKAELDLAVAEFEYAQQALARSQVRAERAGLLVYSAKSDWIGKPVTTGERIMEIGNPEHTEIRIDLPVSDAMVLDADRPVSLFLDGDPLRALPAVVTRASYRPTLSVDQQLVFQVRARFTGERPARIGLRGVARVGGPEVPLWFYLLRRPIAALRQRIGL